MWHLTNIPKILHLYWGRNKPLSFLKLMTPASFAMLNPDWKIKVWVSRDVSDDENWDTFEQKNNSYIHEDLFSELSSIPGVEVLHADIPLDGLSEVQKSDILRLHLLYGEGGFWSDFDIMYVKPMDNLPFNTAGNSEATVGVCFNGDYNIIGFLFGAKGNSFYKALYDRCLNVRESGNASGYQVYGRDVFDAHFKPRSLLSKCGRDLVLNIPETVVYNYNFKVCRRLFVEEGLHVPGEAVGFHWYGGSPASAPFDSNVCRMNIHNFPNGTVLSEARKTTRRSGLEKIRYSFVIPYHDRAPQFGNTMAGFRRLYGKRLDVEVVIVVDKKTSSDSRLSEELRGIVEKCVGSIPVKVVEDPGLSILNPATHFNLGVRESRGKIVILTNPECYHANDVLSGFDEEFWIDPKCYVVPRCESVLKYKMLGDVMEYEHNEYYQHSVWSCRYLHWCNAIRKEDYWRLGGFNERYSEGMAWEDIDFAKRIVRSELRLALRDDLIVIHQDHDRNYNMSKTERDRLLEINRRVTFDIWGEYEDPWLTDEQCDILKIPHQKKVRQP